MSKSGFHRPRIKPTALQLPEREHLLAKTAASVRGLSLSAYLVQLVQEHLAKPKVRAEIEKELSRALALAAAGETVKGK